MGKVSSPPALAAAELSAATTVTAEMNKRKKKKGRPSLIDLQKRNLLNQQQQQQQNQKSLITSSSSSPNLNRRSTRQNPSPEVGDDDDDDERKEKKVKLVVRLPQSNHQQEEQHFDNLPPSSSLNSGSFTSDSDEDGDNPEASPKKRKINAVTDRSGDNLVADQGKKVTKATDPLHGSPLESGPTPLPDKKLLVFILDRLQKKDTYGVFSEPVDPNELPDYHEIIEHPMDFGTVRRKLDAGSYSNLEELEADVFLICSNAMQYNSSDTVYYRRARSIQELAKRDFENLRHEGEDGELRPKVVRRGRPPSKHLKKPPPPSNSSVDCIGPELSSGVTLATVEENTNGSTAYNLRKAPMLYKFQSSDAVLSSRRPRNGENYSESSADWNDEFPASILKADMKHGRKLDLIDETRRDTYKQFQPSAFGREPSLLSDFGGDTKQLMPVGLHAEHSYARSLARFAANLGPVAWKIASKKLGSVLPPGVKFGPGFVGETEAPLESPFFSFGEQKTSSSLACDGNSDGNITRAVTPSTSGVNPAISSGFQGKKDTIKLDRRLSSQNEVAVLRGTPFSGIRQGQTIHTPNKPVFHPDRNGFNGVFGYNFPSQTGFVQPGMPAEHSDPEEASPPTQLQNMVPKSDPSSSPPSLVNSVNSKEHKCSDGTRKSNHGISLVPNSGNFPCTISEGRPSPSWQALTPHPRQYSQPVQPDLNVRLQAPGSPSSGLRVGSPHQPDLALQL